MMILIISIVIWFVYLLGLLYNLIQFPRIDAVYNIRKNWIYADDPRCYKYTSKEMLKASKQNCYGLKTPKDEDFK